MSESDFFQDTAMLMTLAGIVATLCGKLKWPKMLGFIAAGILMNKYTWGGSLLNDPDGLSVTGQLGVLFLMFTMGLDFSTSEMKRMRSVALPVAIVDTMIMTWLGYTVGTRVFGWGMVPSLFLGVAICDSATTMLAKVIDEMKWSGRQFVRYSLASSVCEDIVCVGLIAVITGVASGQGLSIRAAGSSLGGLFVFILAVIVFGMILIPRFLASVAKQNDNESLLLAILGCLFFVSYVAYRFEFSLAIGAFLVGIIGASSDLRNRLMELVAPLRSMFAAIFFVSIGLLVNPRAIFAQVPAILLVTAVVFFGKFINCTLVALFTGQSVKTSVQVGMALAQIGEFAFMVALMYQVGTGDADCPIFDIVVAASILTTLINPFMIRHSAAVGEWAERHLPRSATTAINTYRGFVEKLRTGEREVKLHAIVRTSFLQLVVIAALVFAVAVSCTILSARDWSNFSGFFDAHKRFIFCLLANIFIVAMFAPVIGIGRTLGRVLAIELVGSGETRWQQSMRGIIQLGLLVAVVTLLFIEMAMMNVNLAPDELWARLAIRAILLVAAVFGWRFFVKAAKRASDRFFEAMSVEERREQLGKVMTFVVPENRISRLVLDASSPAIGLTVVALNIRAKTGATVASIERRGVSIRSQLPSTELCVGDVLVVVGEQSQIAAVKDLLGVTAEVTEN